MIRCLILLMCGVSLTLIGVNIKLNQIAWRNAMDQAVVIKGTKVRNSTIGAGAGAVTGGLLAAAVGGFGVVVAGTGFGLPAGAALIASAATMGAGSGAVIGAATGKSSPGKNMITLRDLPFYNSWHWVIIVLIGIILLFVSIMDLKTRNFNNKNGIS